MQHTEEARPRWNPDEWIIPRSQRWPFQSLLGDLIQFCAVNSDWDSLAAISPGVPLAEDSVVGARVPDRDAWAVLMFRSVHGDLTR